MILLLALLACDGAPPAGPAPSPTPDVETLAAWLAELGDAPKRTDDVLRVVPPTAGFEVRVQPMPEDHVVWLSTSPLVTLRQASGERGIVLLLTNMAVLNYETLEGKLQLNAATGDVLLSLELPTDDGLGKATFQDGVRTLVRNAGALAPKLREAATAPEL